MRPFHLAQSRTRKLRAALQSAAAAVEPRIDPQLGQQLTWQGWQPEKTTQDFLLWKVSFANTNGVGALSSVRWVKRDGNRRIITLCVCMCYVFVNVRCVTQVWRVVAPWGSILVRRWAFNLPALLWGFSLRWQSRCSAMQSTSKITSFWWFSVVQALNLLLCCA